jgi:predicted nucleic acid-binding protein
MLVVDASVAAKWALPEPDSDRALALHARGEALLAPSLVVAEIGNAAWKRVRRGLLTRDQGLAATRIAIELISRIVPDTELHQPAAALAVDFGHPIYDCFYLALARREQCTLVTADARLSQLANRIGISVELL